MGTGAVRSSPALWPPSGGPNEHPKSVFPGDAQAFRLPPLAYAVFPLPCPKPPGDLGVLGGLDQQPPYPQGPPASVGCQLPGEEEEESRGGEVAGGALGGSGPPGGHVPLRLSPSHPVLVVFQGGVGSPAVLEELRVRRRPRTGAVGRGTSALALQGVDSR